MRRPCFGRRWYSLPCAPRPTASAHNLAPLRTVWHVPAPPEVDSEHLGTLGQQLLLAVQTSLKAWQLGGGGGGGGGGVLHQGKEAGTISPKNRDKGDAPAAV